MKLIQLEDQASNFDALTDAGYWREFGEFVAYPHTRPGEVAARCADADAILINKTPITAELLRALPRLKYIGVLATGYNVVDLAAARAAGVTVTNVPAYSSSSVAQLVFAHLFNLARQVEFHACEDWSQAPDFCWCLTPQIELDGLTMGLIGFGDIARRVATAALAFGMRVRTFTRTPAKVDMPGVEAVSFEELLRTSDVVSLHCPQTAENRHMIDAAALAMMKPSAFLINTARGGLIDETALRNALLANAIAGAGLDVLGTEPPPADHPLLGLSNCRLTPHIAWATVAARKRLFECARENLRAWCAGQARNVVS